MSSRDWARRPCRPRLAGTLAPALAILFGLVPRTGIALPCGPTVDACLAVCPTAAEVASVDARLDLSFEADPSAGDGFVCLASAGSADLTRVQVRAYQALLMFDRLQFDQALPWTTQTLGGWLYQETMVEGIRFRDDIGNSFCCDPANYLNLQVFDPPNTRWIDPQSGVGLDGLVVLIAHEARHNQGFPHTCGTNDNTRAELGAWGVQYYLREWLAYFSDECFFEAPDPFPTYYLQISAESSWFIHNTRFCFDQPTIDISELPPVPECLDLIFEDGFETGDASAWSGVVPPI